MHPRYVNNAPSMPKHTCFKTHSKWPKRTMNWECFQTFHAILGINHLETYLNCSHITKKWHKFMMFREGRNPITIYYKFATCIYLSCLNNEKWKTTIERKRLKCSQYALFKKLKLSLDLLVFIQYNQYGRISQR